MFVVLVVLVDQLAPAVAIDLQVVAVHFAQAAFVVVAVVGLTFDNPLKAKPARQFAGERVSKRVAYPFRTSPGMLGLAAPGFASVPITGRIIRIYDETCFSRCHKPIIPYPITSNVSIEPLPTATCLISISSAGSHGAAPKT